jgi:hypothetical protein
MCFNFLAEILVLQSKVAEDSKELKPLQKFTSALHSSKSEVETM